MTRELPTPFQVGGVSRCLDTPAYVNEWNRPSVKGMPTV